MRCPIDVTFDFRSDTPPGQDPDARSPTLRAYHKMLWSKALPNGFVLNLDDCRRSAYLHHRSELGEYVLTSDSVIPSFRKHSRIIQFTVDLGPTELQEFVRLSYTIGGMMIFPGTRVDGKATINGERGLNHRIKDRFDLTVECIRRHYRREPGVTSRNGFLRTLRRREH